MKQGSVLRVSGAGQTPIKSLAGKAQSAWSSLMMVCPLVTTVLLDVEGLGQPLLSSVRIGEVNDLGVIDVGGKEAVRRHRGMSY